MKPHRALTRNTRQKPWLYWLVLCLVFRAAIPVGFMPASTTWISLCFGDAGSAALLALSADTGSAHAHSGAHVHPDGDLPHGTASSQVGHELCLFSSVPVNGAAVAGELVTGIDPDAAIVSTLPRLNRATFHWVAPPVRAPPFANLA